MTSVCMRAAGLSCAEGQLGDNLMTSQPESGLLSLPDSRAVRHSLHAQPAREKEWERKGETERTGRGGREGRWKKRSQSARRMGCLGSFSVGEWEPGQGSTKVGEFLIR